MAEISFILVNYNGATHTREFINSVYRYILDTGLYEIIVVDNGSKVDETIALKKEFPGVRFIRSDKNLGFAGGNNLGIKASSGRYIMLINNDTLLIDDSVLTLISFMDENERAGTASPKLYYAGNPKIIQYAGFTQMSKITLRNSSEGFHELDAGQHDKAKQTFATHGAAMIVRREVIEKIGYMPEIYFLYYEELDWCMKMRRYGYELWYQPSAVIVHKESQSTGSDSPLKRFYMVRNRLLFAKRNIGGFKGFLSMIYQIFIADTKSMAISLCFARFDLFKATVKGIFAYFGMKDKLTGVS